ncbi:hypothetical protein KUW17_19910 [Leisingera aquaemixtae]|uniref:hypothetical protein n=1 Tax=Leisingera aquaemixtae TaxID=1396826 RepID=UPI001C94A336|nr:hypothetical protein [Leisingera aquaemixtae]MBY6069018.1 hypothetical protein [Leisingera aquaemixtae]
MRARYSSGLSEAMTDTTVNVNYKAQDQAAFGILVIGYNRPKHLEAVLTSLHMQGYSSLTHVWIDGTQGRRELADANRSSVEVAQRFPVKEVLALKGHLGIEKLMLDALADMSAAYRNVLVLEDDCFPVRGGVDLFRTSLDEVAGRPDVYSVYGHHFGSEPADSRDFTRFQGWGWAACSTQIRKILPELARLYMLPEPHYLAHVAAHMTPDIRARLDRTPPRNVLGVLQSFYSWDSATAFVTAQRGLLHVRTAEVAIRNTGIHAQSGHFHPGAPHLRKPPFSMITVEEAWDYFDAAGQDTGVS